MSDDKTPEDEPDEEPVEVTLEVQDGYLGAGSDFTNDK